MSTPLIFMGVCLDVKERCRDAGSNVERALQGGRPGGKVVEILRHFPYMEELEGMR
jgi:hypothetical protein